MAQLGRALGLGPRGCRFKSCHPDHLRIKVTYKLRDFQTFIKLIEEGIIEVQFKIGIHREEQNLGKTYDRGTDFSIKYDDISNLYKRI